MRAQDVVQFGPLALTLLGQMVSDPLSVPAIFRHVGIGPMLDWARHFAALGAYTVLHRVGGPFFGGMARATKSSRRRYHLSRLVDAWTYGSGSDYRP